MPTCHPNLKAAHTAGRLCPTYSTPTPQLGETGTVLPDADLQIAATAVYYGLELVTGNLRHFHRIPDLTLNKILADARRG